MSVIPDDERCILVFALKCHRKRGARVAATRDALRLQIQRKHWRTMRYREPSVYLWEVVARVYGLPLNPIAYRHARALVETPALISSDRTGRQAYRAGKREALRFELSQRYGLFRGDTRAARERMDVALARLQEEGLVLVDRPVLFLTQRGVQSATALRDLHGAKAAA